MAGGAPGHKVDISQQLNGCVVVVVVQTDCSGHGWWNSWTGGGHLSADHAEEEHSQAVSCHCKCSLCCWLSACFITLQGSLPR